METKIAPDKVYSVDRDKADASKSHIPGWGIDADPENDPTYPMKNWNGADHERFNYEKAPQQRVDMEKLHSIERPGITRVFGTSVPPTGLSGMIRRWAYRYSEATTAHWMGLVFADRVNVVEGIIDDLSKGHVPNIFVERGWRGELKYNRQGFIRTAAITTAVVIGAIWLLGSGRKARKAA